jgi:AraC-like DNA-binding protein
MSLEPATAFYRFGEDSTPPECRIDNRFHISLVETTGALGDQVRKCSSVPAILVSMSLRPLAAANYQLRVDGKIVRTSDVAAYRAHVIDLATEPQIWAGTPLNYVHFHVRRSCIEQVAADFGYERPGGFRIAILEPDLVLASITRSVLPGLANGSPPPTIALDQLELILGAHLLLRYGGTKPRLEIATGGLAVWQKRRAEELLRENLNGRVRLAELARECELSLSHFARAFKVSFGVSCYRWLLNKRVERAQELLVRTDSPLVEIASQCGFGDQAAFTRTFSRFVGVAPGRWRRVQSER